MKYSLSSRQSAEYLFKADEIKVQYRDRDIIFSYIEKYPQATINLTRYYTDLGEPIDWNEIKTFNTLAQGRFIFGLTVFDEMNMAKENNIAHYYLGPVRTFSELSDLKRAGVNRITVSAPLFFQLDKVKEFGIPVYMTANVSQSDSLFSRPDGVTGCWIRPEDVDIYSEYIDVLEFSGNKNQEQALYRIYAEQKKWDGDLNMIVQDINHEASNRLIPPIFAERRVKCAQRCQENGKCRFCYRILDLANPTKLKDYLEATKHT